MKFRSLDQTTITSEPSDIPKWKARLAAHVIAEPHFSAFDRALDRAFDPDLGLARDVALDDVRNCTRDLVHTLYNDRSRTYDNLLDLTNAAVDRALDRAFDRAIDRAVHRAPDPARPASTLTVDRALAQAFVLARTLALALKHTSLFAYYSPYYRAACVSAHAEARADARARGFNLDRDFDSFCSTYDRDCELSLDHDLAREVSHVIDRVLHAKFGFEPEISSLFLLGRSTPRRLLECLTVRPAFERAIKRLFNRAIDDVVHRASESSRRSDRADFYRVAIKHAHGTEEMFVATHDPNGKMQTVNCNTFLQRDSGKGGRKSEIIVYRGDETEIFATVKIRENKSLYRIPLDPKHRLVLTLQLGREMSAPEVADACFEDAKAAINEVADNDPEGLEKLQKATARLRYVTDLGVHLANDNINSFAEAGLQVAQLALQKLVELNVHSNSTLNQDVLECVQRINSRKVLWTKSKPLGLRKALSSAVSQALDVLETILRPHTGSSSCADQSHTPCDIQKKRVFLEQCSEAIDAACFAGHDRNLCGRKRTVEELLSRFIEALKLLLEELLFNCPLNGDYRVVIKYVNDTEYIVLESRGGAVSANKRKVFLPVNVVGMTVALHFYTRRVGFGEKTVAFFETQLIVPGDNHLMHEIRFARCDATLQLSFGEELSAAEVVNVRQRQASEALAAASGSMDKVAQCTRDLRFFVDLAVAGSEINPFAKTGFSLAKLGFDTLNEVSGTHDAFTKLSDQCDEYIDIINDIGEVFTSRRVQAETRKALIAISGALERISCHYEQTWIKRLTRSSVKEAEDLSRDLKDRLSTMVSLAALTEIRANQIKC
ncbi:hypothetical protein MSAN_00263600 [Mycena sanguinolenta]|uniref:Uncharacterized protein n=1 Tax=Mycena sanguinolenta TaxID=230812 RepID=A0A8H7DN15_9AGAR|nr:hypothetical protein MSAN_00263600 [Mycena sanguinolenta]